MPETSQIAKPLAGRVSIVTGASGGLGAALALALAEAGSAVVLAARRGDQIDDLALKIEVAGGVALAVPTDVTSEAAVIALFERTHTRFGRLDLLVNNAGIADHTPIESLSLARWHAVIDINLTAAFLCAREAMKLMKPQRRGRIINIGSISARVPRPNNAAYAASKFGLEGLTRSLALDGREHGITASILHPGVTATELVPGMAALPAEQAMRAEDVARMVVLMATMPDEANILELVTLPIGMPFLGRG